MRASSGQQALEILAQLALRARPVALVLSDQRMPNMSGVEMLAQAREHAPDAKFMLLTAYADTDAAIAAINEVGLDYYLQKPWDPPEDRLYPVVDDLLGDWRRATPTTPENCRWWATAGRKQAMSSRRSCPAIMSSTNGSSSSATTRPGGWPISPAPASTTCRS